MKFLNLNLLSLGLLALLFSCQPQSQPITQPEIEAEAKPWTRWWWHGSAVDKEGISSELQALKDAGIGGVEITPIFGVRGTEEQFLEFLSPEWVDAFLHTLKEAKKLGLGVDMATGTGWPFGGPWIGDDHAAKYMTHKVYELENGRLDKKITCKQVAFVRGAGGRLNLEDIKYPVSSNENLQELAIDQIRYEKELPLLSLMGYSDEGETLDLTEKVSDGVLDWEAKGKWKLYAVFQGWHGKMVERAAPGGEGLVMDHFSKAALDHYLSKFDSALAGKEISGLRAFFNDSYEVDDARGEANWTPGFFEAFNSLHGYDLKAQLPALFEESHQNHQRVLMDYRTAIEKLLYENFTKVWKDWGHKNGAIIRNQAHGSPSNILDLYSLVDIPETEGTEILKIKFASSAANVMGKKLTSSESATWLNDHFLSSLSEVKQNLERYFLGGVNHVFYHGTAYSPDTAQWPGWLFYAAIHANDRNAWWEEFSTLNEYVANVQAFLQNSSPSNDILLYFPVQDRYAEPAHGLLEHFDIRGNFYKSEVKKVGEELWEKGYSFDLVSDRQIGGLAFENGQILSHGTSYKAVLLPSTRFIPLKTLEKLNEMAKNGANILFHKNLPQDVPGLANLEARKSRLETLNQEIQGRAKVDKDLPALLNLGGISREEMVDKGLQFIRKKYKDGHCYFITNWTESSIEGYLPLAAGFSQAAIVDPMTGRKGLARTRSNEVLIQLKKGESCLLLTSNKEIQAEPFPYWEEQQKLVSFKGSWDLNYVRGGEGKPTQTALPELSPWNTWDEEMQYFSGTLAYSQDFNLKKTDAKAYKLDLGKVHNSATVYLNGEKAGTLIGPEFSLVIPAEKLKQGKNELKIEVSNLMANRIIKMDKEGVPYRKFYNTNFPAHDRENRNLENGLFHADHWEPLTSGLLGPVSLVSLGMLSE